MTPREIPERYSRQVRFPGIGQDARCGAGGAAPPSAPKTNFENLEDLVFSESLLDRPQYLDCELQEGRGGLEVGHLRRGGDQKAVRCKDSRSS